MGEVLGLMWDCVDFSRGTTTVKRQLRREQKKGGKYYLSTPKNGKVRTIAPAPEVMELLRCQKARQDEQKLKAGEVWMDSGFVFTNGIGDRLSYRLTGPFTAASSGSSPRSGPLPRVSTIFITQMSSPGQRIFIHFPKQTMRLINRSFHNCILSKVSANFQLQFLLLLPTE